MDQVDREGEASMTDGPIALVDMDGTIADYDTGMRVGLEALRSPEETGPVVIHGSKADMPEHYRARVKMVRNQAGWWKHLLILPDGFQIVEMLKNIGFEIHVLTKGPKSSPNAFTEKICWCKRHMPGVPVTLTENKGLVYGRVLVDDWPSYVEAWLKFRLRGLVVMPDRPWNQGFEHPNVVRARLYPDDHPNARMLSNYDEVFEALKAAFAREEGAPLVL